MVLQHDELKIGSYNKQVEADRAEITFYTDPLCCWSWAFEPQWRRLLYEYGEQVTFHYVMAGLLPSWKTYNDPAYSIHRPVHMGPVWLEASTVSGMPLQDKIWVNDPPASSYPACIAVKCAQLQSPLAGEKYLRLIREAVMINGQNIARVKILIDIAYQLSELHPGLLDTVRFQDDLTNDTGLEAFRGDWQEVQNRNINRFPTLIIRNPGKPAILITGYRPYQVLVDALKQIVPEIKPLRPFYSIDDYKRYWGNLTQREIDEITNS